MYEILLFGGGVYKFDELVEFIEDIGGIVLNKEQLDISRGNYFLSEEIRVLLIVPKKEVESVKLIVKEIKGEIEDLNLTDDQSNAFLSYFPIYSILCGVRTWISKEDLKNLIDCPCYPINCRTEDENCTLDRLDFILNDMCSISLIESRTFKGIIEYRLKEAI